MTYSRPLYLNYSLALIILQTTMPDFDIGKAFTGTIGDHVNLATEGWIVEPTLALGGSLGSIPTKGNKIEMSPWCSEWKVRPKTQKNSFISKSYSKVEWTGALNFCLNASSIYVIQGWLELRHTRLAGFHPSTSLGSSKQAALCIHPKIRRTRSFYLTIWLCLHIYSRGSSVDCQVSTEKWLLITSKKSTAQ